MKDKIKHQIKKTKDSFISEYGNTKIIQTKDEIIIQAPLIEAKYNPELEKKTSKN